MKHARYSRRGRHPETSPSRRTLFYRCIIQLPAVPHYNKHRVAPPTYAMTGDEKLYLLHLARFMNPRTLRDCSMCYMQSEIETGLSRRTLMRLSDTLQAKGWLQIGHRQGFKAKSGQRQNVYHGLIPVTALAELNARQEVSGSHLWGQEVSGSHHKRCQAGTLTEDSTEEEREGLSQRATRGKKTRVVGPIPDDFPTQEHREWVAANRPNASDTVIAKSFERFRQYYAGREHASGMWSSMLERWFEDEREFKTLKAGGGGAAPQSAHKETDRVVAERKELGAARATIRFELRTWMRTKNWSTEAQKRVGPSPNANNCRPEVEQEAVSLAMESEEFAAFLQHEMAREQEAIVSAMGRIKDAIEKPDQPKRRDAA